MVTKKTCKKLYKRTKSGGGGWFGKKSPKSPESPKSTERPKSINSTKGTEGETPRRIHHVHLKSAIKAAAASFTINEYMRNKNVKRVSPYFIHNPMTKFLKNTQLSIPLPNSSLDIVRALDQAAVYRKHEKDGKYGKYRTSKEVIDVYTTMGDFFKNKKNNPTQELSEEIVQKFYTTFAKKDQSQKDFKIKLEKMLKPKPQKQQKSKTPQQTPQTQQTQQTQKTANTGYFEVAHNNIS